MNRARIMIHSELPTTPRFWASAVKELNEREFWVDYVVTQKASPPRFLRGLDCDFFSLECRNSHDYPKAVLRLRTLLRERHIDILHASEPIQGSIGGLACRAFIHSKCLYHRHHASDVGGKSLSRIAALTSHRTVAVSNAAADHARKHDIFNRDRLQVVHNGVDELRPVGRQEIGVLQNEMSISPNERVIVSVAHLRPEKGHRFLIRAMDHILPHEADKVHLVIVGDGVERQALEKDARKSHHTSIHFVGEKEDVAPWYALSDIVAIPSIHESFGLTAIEAMAASRPVVASRVGGLPDIVRDQQTGILVPPGDSASIAHAILELLSMEKAQRYGIAGRLIYQSAFTTDHMINGWIDVYQHMLVSKGAPTGSK